VTRSLQHVQTLTADDSLTGKGLRRRAMKKTDDRFLSEETMLLSKEQGDRSPAAKPAGGRGSGKTDNIYTDTINSLMEKNRKRVSTYYCANIKCKGTFWESSHGYRCPECGSLGVISSFNGDSAEKQPHGYILGYIDSVGRIFCNECAERFRLGDDISMIIYNDSEYRHENCEVCRAALTIPS
jgi:hypothetical protein